MINLKRVGWENGTLVESAKVLADGTVQPAQYEGSTPLSANNLKAMEDNTEEALNEIDSIACYQGTCTDKELEQAVSSSSDTDLTVLEDKDGGIIDANIPRYEKFKNKMDDIFKFEHIQSGAIDLPANSNRAINIGVYHIPEGYEYIGVLPLSGGIADAVQTTFSRYNGNNIYVYINSFYPAQLTFSVSCTVIYVKTDYYNQNLVS